MHLVYVLRSDRSRKHNVLEDKVIVNLAHVQYTVDCG